MIFLKASCIVICLMVVSCADDYVKLNHHNDGFGRIFAKAKLEPFSTNASKIRVAVDVISHFDVDAAFCDSPGRAAKQMESVKNIEEKTEFILNLSPTAQVVNLIHGDRGLPCSIMVKNRAIRFYILYEENRNHVRARRDPYHIINHIEEISEKEPVLLRIGLSIFITVNTLAAAIFIGLGIIFRKHYKYKK